MIYFNVCDFLLKGKIINIDTYDNIMRRYHNYLLQVNLNDFDEYAKNHYGIVV